ncbi:hypothetical protein Tco_1415880, partial [Tanacetum coccineum]
IDAIAATLAILSNGTSGDSDGSISKFRPSGVGRRGRAHATKFSCPDGIDMSTGFLPVRSSRSTTPLLYTSLFTRRWLVIAYSGATYLKSNEKKFKKIWTDLTFVLRKSSFDFKFDL